MSRSDSKHAEPMSVAACRRFLGRVGEGVSDDDVARLRDELYAFAAAAVTVYEQNASDTAETSALNSLPPTARDDVEERAAIIQFDAHLPRGMATRAAVSAYVTAAKKGR